MKPANYTVSQTTDWLPKGVTLVAEKAAAIDPLAKTVATEGGTKLAYDFLIVAPGLVLDYEACLLYTSPSPRDRQKSRMPSSA